MWCACRVWKRRTAATGAGAARIAAGRRRAALAGLVRDRRVECHLSGHDRMGRPYAATAIANGVDLSSAIVASGWARAQQDRPGLANLELAGAPARAPGCGPLSALAQDMILRT